MKYYIPKIVIAGSEDSDSEISSSLEGNLVRHSASEYLDSARRRSIDLRDPLVAPSALDRSNDYLDTGLSHIDFADHVLSRDEMDAITRGMGGLRVRRKSRDISKPKKQKELPQYSLYDVMEHDTLEDCWVAIHDKVYDITDFMQEHPGGDDLLMEYAGRDATIAFASVGHSTGALNALRKYLVGVLREEDRIYPDGHTWS